MRSTIGAVLIAVPSILAIACGPRNGGSGGSGGRGGSAGSAAGRGGTSGTAGTGGTTSTQPAAFCGVLNIVRAKCHSCHAAERQFGAPMSLVTHADFTRASVTNPSRQNFQQMGTRIHDVQRPMPPVGYPGLTPAELATIDAWVAQGAPNSSTACGPSTAPPPPVEPPPVEFPADCEQTYELRAGQNGAPYVIQPGQETHPQFFFTPPWPGEAQALVMAPITDNKKVLHHWIVYAGAQFVTGWAPGSEVDRRPLPPDVGMWVPAGGSGTQLRLDMHYNNVGGTTAESDRSGVKICVINTRSKFRPKTATVTMGFVAIPSLPPNAQVDNVGTCRVNATRGPVTLITSSPHMHQFGTWAKLEITRTNGRVEVVHDKPFSFEDQRTWQLNPGVILNTGDVVRTTCRYVNTTTRRIGFSMNTDGEMCFNFATYYPMGGLSCSF